MADNRATTPDYSRVSIVPVAVLTVVISCSFAALRFLTAHEPLLKWRSQAVCLLLAVTFAVVCMGTSISMYVNGLGFHSDAVSDAQLSVFLKMLWLDGLASTISLTCAKLSILFLYLRLLTFQAPRVLCKAFIAFTAVTHLWIIISILTACVPLSSLWNSAAVHGADQHVYCHPRAVFWLDFGLSVMANVLIFTLPIPLMFYVVVPKFQHAMLFAMPLAGYGICAVSAVRASTHVTHIHSNDSTSTSVSYVNLTIAEISLTIIWACVFGLPYIYDPLYETQDHPPPFISHAEKLESSSPIFPHNIPPQDLHRHQQHPVQPLPVAVTTRTISKHRPVSSQDSVPWGQNITRYSSSLFAPSSSSCALIAAANNMATATSTSTFTLSLVQTLADAANDDASDDEPDMSLASALAAAHRRRASDGSGFLPIFAHSDPSDADDVCVTDKDGHRRSYKILDIPRSTTPNSLRFAMPPKPKPLRPRGGAADQEEDGDDDEWMTHPGERQTLTVPMYAPAHTWWG